MEENKELNVTGMTTMSPTEFAGKSENGSVEFAMVGGTNTTPNTQVADETNAKSLETYTQPQQEVPVNAQPTISVQQLNEKVAQAAGMTQPAQPTAKQLEKAKKEQERYWNTMISRKDAKQMVEDAVNETRQHIQLMYIQVQSMFEMLTDKGHATVEEMEEYSKKVLEKVFGQPPVAENTPEQPVSEEVSKDAGNNGADSSN